MHTWRWMFFLSFFVGLVGFQVEHAVPSTQVYAQSIGEMVKVEVSVPPKATSIRTWLTANPSRPVVNQGQTITYTFAYQSTNSSPVPLTLQVYWGLGTTQGIGEDDIPGLIYQVGSASHAYSGSPPVVDLSARTITWQIKAFPKTNEPQQVEFKLKTSDVYQGAGLVTFPIEGRVASIEGVPVVRRSVGYVYHPATPKHTSSELLDTVSILAVNDVSAQIEVLVPNELTHVVLQYGEAAENLNQTALRTQSGHQNRFFLSNLRPESTTFFRITAETSEQSLTSDVFSFSTSAQPSQVVLKPWLLTIAHRNLVLRSGKVDDSEVRGEMSGESVKPLKIEQQELLDVTLNLPDSPDVHLAEIMLKGPEIYSTQLTQIGPGTFAAKLQVPTTLGRYEVVSRISDEYGNAAETKLQEIDVKPALKVVDGRTGLPLPGAEVTLYAMDTVTGGYEIISDVGMIASNPLRSDSLGLVPITRKAGAYRVSILVPGYQPLHKEFELDTEGLKEFPQLELQTAGRHWIGRLRYQLSLLKV